MSNKKDMTTVVGDKKQDTCFIIIPLLCFGNGIIDFMRKQRKLLTPSEREVWRILALYAGYDGECFPKQKTIAEQSGYSGRTIRRALFGLKKKGFILINSGCSHRSNNYFFVLHNVFFQLPFMPDCLAHKADQSGNNGRVNRTKEPTIPSNSEKITPQKQRSVCEEGGCVFLAHSSPTLDEDLEKMIQIVASQKDNPSGWATAVKKKFEQGLGDIESLKKEAFNIIDNHKNTYEDWASLLDELINKYGADKFLSTLRERELTHLKVEDRSIPIDFVLSYAEAKNENI